VRGGDGCDSKHLTGGVDLAPMANIVNVTTFFESGDQIETTRQGYIEATRDVCQQQGLPLTGK
jgi:hypothetical protein